MELAFIVLYNTIYSMYIGYFIFYSKPANEPLLTSISIFLYRGPKASKSDSEVSRKHQITKSIILDFGIFEQQQNKRRDFR